MIAKPVPATLTIEEYFAIEAVENDRRYEYIDGEIFAMTGGTNNHSLIKLNVSGNLYRRLAGSNCSLRDSDMRVKISDSRYVYPDLSAVCGAPLLEDNSTTLLNPVMAVEVTSPTSHYYDRADKLGFYSSVPSMRVYLIIDQHQVEVELHTGTEKGWLRQIYSNIDDVLVLDALGCSLPLVEVYRNIVFNRS